MNAISLATKGIISSNKLVSSVTSGGGVIVKKECIMPSISIKRIKIDKEIKEQIINESILVKVLSVIEI